ncbi:MAG: hypothetical protein LAO21_19505 [Acidobacteriia bacterium]|nr:hypothetical protein [Terriglobia bacterium]
MSWLFLDEVNPLLLRIRFGTAAELLLVMTVTCRERDPFSGIILQVAIWDGWGSLALAGSVPTGERTG